MTQPQPQPAETSLTEREKEVALLVSFALTDREIAARLFVTVDTVKAHINNIRSKVSLRNRTDVCRWVLVMKYENNIHLLGNVFKG
jgi:DNA-binding NarL/FixJ family response regulator